MMMMMLKLGRKSPLHFASVLMALMMMTMMLVAPCARAQSSTPSIALLVGNSDPANRGDFMREAMNGAVFGCGGSFEDAAAVQEVVSPGPFEGPLCTVTYYFVDDAVQGGDSACSNDCVVDLAVSTGYDLIIAVAFQYGNAIQEAAAANPDVDFGIIDVAYFPPLENVEAFVWREDQMGFLSGVVAAEVAKEIGETVIGAVGGPPIPPVRKFVNGFSVGVQDVCPECTLFEVFSESFGSLEEGFAHADTLLEAGVKVAACGGGFTGSMACKRLAENGVYVIGVDVDEYVTTFENGEASGSAFILTSALKSTSTAVQQAIECFLFNFAECVGKNNLLDASNNGIAFADCHETCDVYTEETRNQVDDLFRALADEAISTGVDMDGNLIESSVEVLSPSP